MKTLQRRPRLRNGQYYTPPETSKLHLLKKQYLKEKRTIDVPKDGRCLFNAMLLPSFLEVLNDNKKFQDRFNTLFGDTKNLKQEEFKKLLIGYVQKNCAPSYLERNKNELNKFVDAFRAQLGMTLEKNANDVRIKDFMLREQNATKTSKDTIGEKKDDRAINKEVKELLTPGSSAWGNEYAILAMNLLSKRNIDITNSEGKKIPEASLTMESKEQPLELVFMADKKHYNYKISNAVINRLQQTVLSEDKKDTGKSADKTQGTADKQQSGTEKKKKEEMLLKCDFETLSEIFSGVFEQDKKDKHQKKADKASVTFKDNDGKEHITIEKRSDNETYLRYDSSEEEMKTMLEKGLAKAVQKRPDTKFVINSEATYKILKKLGVKEENLVMMVDGPDGKKVEKLWKDATQPLINVDDKTAVGEAKDGSLNGDAGATTRKVGTTAV